MKRTYLTLLTTGVFFLIVAAGISPAEASSKNFLWHLESPSGRQAYIMGSIHLAHAGLYPLDRALTEAFADSELLVVEINTEGLPAGTMERFVADHGFVRDRRPLPERLSSRTGQALTSSGYYQPQMAQMTPWMAALVIQMEVMRRNGFSSEYGLDKHFIGEAKKRGLRILELETLDEQMGMLVNMSEKEADLFLLSSLLEMDDLPQIMRTFLNTWKSGDIDGFAGAFFGEYDKYPELRPVLDIIIFRRNREMASKINGLVAMEGGVCFIVVGAGHLVGEGSILSDLHQWGWKVRQL